MQMIWYRWSAQLRIAWRKRSYCRAWNYNSQHKNFTPWVKINFLFFLSIFLEFLFDTFRHKQFCALEKIIQGQNWAEIYKSTTKKLFILKRLYKAKVTVAPSDGVAHNELTLSMRQKRHSSQSAWPQCKVFGRTWTSKHTWQPADLSSALSIFE
jgi:hypothetical protein